MYSSSIAQEFGCLDDETHKRLLILPVMQTHAPIFTRKSGILGGFNWRKIYLNRCLSSHKIEETSKFILLKDRCIKCNHSFYFAERNNRFGAIYSHYSLNGDCKQTYRSLKCTIPKDFKIESKDIFTFCFRSYSDKTSVVRESTFDEMNLLFDLNKECVVQRIIENWRSK